MLLAIDVGNSHIVSGIFSGYTLVHQWRMQTVRRSTADELAGYFSSLLALEKLVFGDISGVAIASVVPSLQAALQDFSVRFLDVEPFIVSNTIDSGIRIVIDHPGEVGADRIANVAAAYHRYKTALIVVDFGTAITCDCVSAKGEYLGGAIAPGLMISLEALGSRTARLPQVDISFPPVAAIGTNTVAAIKSGVIYGYAGLADGLIRRLRIQMADPDIRVLATGGMARIIAPHSDTIEKVEPDLTLEGLKLLFERNN